MTAGPPQETSARRQFVADRREQRPAPRWRRGLVGPDDDDPVAREISDPVDHHQHRTPTSRTLHRLYDASSHAVTGTVVALLTVVWVVVGILTRFPSWWQTVLYSTSAAITLIMVFAIQHTQTRQQTAIQRKLDELLRTQPSADARLIASEEAPDEELQARADLNWNDRECAREEAT